MSAKPIISALLALPHYPNEEPYSPADLDLVTDLVQAGTPSERELR
jgi:hypothetical protein